MIMFTNKVGVAPGTTTLQLKGLGRYYDPYTDIISLNDSPLAPLVPDRPIRWDLVGVVGGGSLLIALTAAFIASALHR